MPVGECGSPIRDAMCSMLTGTLDTAITRIQMARDNIRFQVRAIERQLKALIPGLPQDILDAIDAINNFEVPIIDTPANLKCMATFIEGCSYLKNSPFGNVAAITNRLASFFNQNLFDNLLSLFPDLGEFSISWNISAAMDFTSGLGIDTIMSEFNQLTQCVSSFCDVDIQDKLDSMTTLLSDMSLNSSGILDIETIMIRSGIPKTSRDAIRNIVEAVDSKKSEISETMEDGVEVTRGVDYSDLVTEHLFESEIEFELVIAGADLLINRVPLEREATPLSIVTSVSALTIANIVNISSTTCSLTSNGVGTLTRGTSEILSSTITSKVSITASMIYTKLALNSTCSVATRVEPRLTVT